MFLKNLLSSFHHLQVEIGSRKADVLSREEFISRREMAEQAKRSKLENAPKLLASANKDLSAFPFLRHLAAREELVRQLRTGRIVIVVEE